jgi:hypothetical protein
MSEKQALVDGAEVEFERFKRAIAGLSEAEMRETWSGTWSVRDIVAHISGWHREIGPALERLARGEKPVPEGVSYQDPDPWNARFAAAKTAASTAEVLAELDASHAYFMQAARAVDEARFVPEKTAYKLVDLNSRHHYQEHTADIEGWRKSHRR